MKRSTRKKQHSESENYPRRGPQPRRSDEGQDQPDARQRNRPADMPGSDRDPDETPESAGTPSGQDEE